MSKKFKEIYLDWLLPVKYEHFYLIEDLSEHETILDGVFDIPIKDIPKQPKLKFYINGVELPNDSAVTNITFKLP